MRYRKSIDNTKYKRSKFQVIHLPWAVNLAREKFGKGERKDVNE